MSQIAPTELKRLLDEDAGLTVIDVRTELEFGEVHVPDVRNIPLDELAPERQIEDGELPAEEPIYILCRSGARAQKAADQFLGAGYGNAIVVEGGTLAWIAANLPVTRGEATGS